MMSARSDTLIGTLSTNVEAGWLKLVGKFVRRSIKLAVGLILCAPPIAAAPLVADLSSSEVAISTGFTGTELLLFGASEGKGDVIVVVRGPRRAETVRRKMRLAGIWVNVAEKTFLGVPGYYRVAATRPLVSIATPAILAEAGIGVDSLRLLAPGHPDEVALYREALVRNKRRLGLFGSDDGAVKLMDGRLFRTTITFPARVPTGLYLIDVHLFVDGKRISTRKTSLLVGKVGLEAEIFNFAHNRSALYGIMAVVIALLAGWAAELVFRKV